MSILLIRNMKRATLILLFTVNFAVNAQTFRGGEIFRIKDSDVYWAAVKTEYFVESVARQEEDYWCWAACIQAVLRYHDMRFSQSDIVRQVYDDSYNWTASGNRRNRIAQSLNGWNNLYVYSYRDKSIQVLIDNLIKHYPLIIGNAEHAYLLTQYPRQLGQHKPIQGYTYKSYDSKRRGPKLVRLLPGNQYNYFDHT